MAWGVEPLSIYPAAHLIAAWLLAPLAVASLATGVLLSVTTGWKPFVHAWVTVKGVITLVLTSLLLALLVPGLGRAAAIATGTAIGPLTHARQTLYTVIPATGAALLTLNAVLGVVKPRRRRPRTQPWRATEVGYPCPLRAFAGGRPSGADGRR